MLNHSYRPDHWALPSGWIKKGESPLKTIEREVKEETGLNIKALRILLFGNGKNHRHIEIVVEAKLIGGGFIPSSEVSEMKWIPDDSLEHLINVNNFIYDINGIGYYIPKW
jgi:ADP-ribose pyrophosphatase YjhB (NUDIX family)